MVSSDGKALGRIGQIEGHRPTHQFRVQRMPVLDDDNDDNHALSARLAKPMVSVIIYMRVRSLLEE